jgi:hypothetical protein
MQNTLRFGRAACQTGSRILAAGTRGNVPAAQKQDGRRVVRVFMEESLIFPPTALPSNSANMRLAKLARELAESDMSTYRRKVPVTSTSLPTPEGPPSACLAKFLPQG